MDPNTITRVWTKGANVEVENLRGTAFTEEAKAHTFKITGVDADGEPLPLTGTVTARFLRADNTTIAIAGSISGGVASLTLVKDCYNVAGRFSLVIYLSDGTTVMAIYACVGNIYRATTDKTIDSGTTVPSLAELEGAYNSAVAAAASANSAAAAANKVNIALTKSGKVMTVTTTNSSGMSTSKTIQEPTLTVTKSGETVTVTAVDVDGTTTANLTDPNIRLLLLADEVPDTVQTFDFGDDGSVSAIHHGSVRTDTYTYGDGTITEKRTLAAGPSLTMVTDLDTLETTVTYSNT